MTTKLNITAGYLCGASLTFRFNDVRVSEAMFVFHVMLVEPLKPAEHA